VIKLNKKLTFFAIFSVIFLVSSIVLVLYQLQDQNDEIPIKNDEISCEYCRTSADYENIKSYQDDIEVHYTLNQHLNDSSGNKRHADKVGDPLYTQGYCDCCLFFDGVNDYIHHRNNTAFDYLTTDNFSFSFCFKTDQISTAQLIGKYDATGYAGFHIDIIGASGVLEFEIESASSKQITVRTTTAGLNNYNFHHVMITYDGSEVASGVQIFINGTKETNVVVSDDLVSLDVISNTNYLQISGTNTTNLLNGFMDEVAVFSSNLTYSEIQDITQNGILYPTLIEEEEEEEKKEEDGLPFAIQNLPLYQLIGISSAFTVFLLYQIERRSIKTKRGF
jgi:hypothetical protein